MKRMRRLTTLLVASALLLIGITGCTGSGGRSTQSQSKKDESQEGSSSSGATGGLDLSEEVEIVMYAVSDRPAGQDELEANYNAVLKEKMNTTIKLNWIGWAEYANKYPLLFSSGEKLDLAYAATWLNYASLARKGAFMNLDELWPEYAPLNYKRQSNSALQQATVDGHYYAIPTLMATYSAYGPHYRTDILEDTDWNGKMDTIADYEIYLDYVKENTTLEPYNVYAAGSEMDDLFMFNNGLYALKGSTNDFLFFDPAEEDPQLFSYYDYEKTPEFLEMMNRWNEKGFFSKSGLSDTDRTKVQNGKAASEVHNIDTYAGRHIENPERGYKFKNFVSDPSYMSFTQDAMVVSNTSKNPERALAVYDLITNDEEAYRAFINGIEGVSYEIIDGQIKTLDPVTYPGSPVWSARTSEFNLPTFGSPDDLITFRESFDAAIVDGEGSQAYRSFVQDISSIETEYAACQNVHQQYWWPLELGYTDPVEGLAEYKAQMKAAGIDKVIEVLQGQLDAYITEMK